MTDEPHQRRCWDCGNVAEHANAITPAVLCTKCGSQDTRRLLRLGPHRYPDYQVSTIPPTPSLKSILAMQGDGGKEAWETVWDWCHANGMEDHVLANLDRYGQLNGPQKVCQWILDLKDAK